VAKNRKVPVVKNISRIGMVSVRLLFLVALGISMFLAWTSWTGGAVPGCGPESQCDKVLGSKWGYVFGLPVSVVAAMVYLAAIGMTLQKVVPWKQLLVVSVTIILAAIWFVGLQVIPLGALCKFCLVAHAAGVTAAVILIRGNPMPKRTWAKPIRLAAVLVAALVIAQMVSPEPAPVQVKNGVSGPDAQASSPGTPPLIQGSNVAGMGFTSTNQVASVPAFSILQGQFTLNLTQVPVTGPVNAPKKMVKLFDFTCHHCRDLHHLLKPVQQKYGEELAVVSLPMPLDAKCNRFMRSTPSAHINACEYARLSLAVFYAEPKAFHDYADWLFAPARPPEVDAAREHAAELIGRERLIAMLADPRVDDQIQRNVEIYAASSRAGRSSAMPQMIFPAGASIGAVSDLRQLEKILLDAFGARSGMQ
jgi:uncharacterized membrane protein